MVVLNVKKGDDAQFLYETTTAIAMDELLDQLAEIYNERLRIDRLCMGKMTRLMRSPCLGLGCSSWCVSFLILAILFA
jgi:hypothetical protein